MKRDFILITLLMLCGLGIVRADDKEPQYRLNVPSANDYLSRIAEILN